MRFEALELGKSFGDKRVLDGVSFSVSSGAALGLLGRNGAGKTTTLRLIMGVFYGEGRLLLDGAPFDRKALKIGYLPEERGLYPKKPILEQLVYFGALRGVSPKAARSAAMRWLERLDMGSVANARLDTLSKGNQQKIQLCCSLVTDPDFVILDEPFSGLDPVNAQLLRDVVAELITEGKLVLFSSHQMSYVEEFCQDIAILHGGKIALAGRIRDLRRAHPQTDAIITTAAPEQMANFLTGHCASVSVTDEEVTVQLAAGQDLAALTAVVAASGIPFDSVRIRQPSLEDLFVATTGGKD